MKRMFSVRIHPAGMLVYAAAFLLMDSHLVLAATAALALHEGAHLLTMLLCGMRGCTIELTPFGGMADVQNFDAHEPWKRMLASVSGAAASLIAAILCCHAPPSAFWRAFFQANLSLGVLNILPAWPLDGARAAAALASCIGLERQVRRVMSWMTLLLGTGLVLLGLIGVWHGIINPGLLVMGPYLCYAARAEQLSEKVRRLDGLEQKMQTGSPMAAEVWMARADRAESFFAALLGRGDRRRCQVMLAVDPVSGAVQRCWTEKEMLNHLMDAGRN